MSNSKLPIPTESIPTADDHINITNNNPSSESNKSFDVISDAKSTTKSDANSTAKFFVSFWKLKTFLVCYLVYNLFFGLIISASPSLEINTIFVIFSYLGTFLIYMIMGIEINKKLYNNSVKESLTFVAKSSLFLALILTSLNILNTFLVFSKDATVSYSELILSTLSTFVFSFFLVGILGSVGVFLDSMIFSKKTK